jgi:flavodoxin
MKAIVIYDSQFGNTAKIAAAIHEALAARGESSLIRAADVTDAALAGRDLVVVGSPTQRFHATEPVAHFLEGRALPGVHVAAFDTRLDMAEVDSRALRLAVKLAGDNAWAATRIAGQLEKAGAMLVAEPEGFIVEDTEGPLRAGELERAAAWAGQLVS